MVDLLDDDALLDLGPRRRGPRANAALEAWAKQAEPPAPPPVEGMCHVCQTRPARRACASCGQPTCAADLWVMLGLCLRCTSERRPAKGNWLEET